MFRDTRQFHLFAWMLFTSLCCATLVLLRIWINRHALSDVDSMQQVVWTRGITFLFLLWNLALAWVPYLAALWAERLQRLGAGRWRVGAWLVVWLAFLPNAPYIITDFIHFHHRPPVPLWLDLTLLFAAACTGLLLGLFSLYEVHGVLRKWMSATWSHICMVASIGLSGFGIWLGRFQRWNSWDIVTRPADLLQDIAETFTTRHELVRALGISGLLSGVLLGGYLLLLILLGSQRGAGSPE